MAQTSEHQPSDRGVVRPLSRAAGRPCARPGCPSPSRATLTFSYEKREAWLGPLREERPPHGYDLCAAHADRTQPPRGWRFVDDRPDEDAAADTELGGEHTVAVLAAALHGRKPLPGTPDTDGDPLREALEELQAVSLPLPGQEADRDLRLVDPEERRRRREEAEDAVPGDGIRSTVERARRAADELVRGSGPARDRAWPEPEATGGAPGRQVPAAARDEGDDDPGPATLW